MNLRGLGALLPCVLLSSGTALAGEAISYSLDLTVEIGSTIAEDDEVVDDETGTIVDLGPLPAGVDVNAYHVLEGDPHFSLDTAAELAGGIFAEARDVVRYADGVYTVVFDGSEEGVPAGAEIDALTSDGADLVLSFDVDVEIQGLFVADEDLASFGGSFQLLFDGSEAGVSSALDLDAASVAPDSDLVVSFDTGGSIDGLVVADEDMLRWDGGTAFAVYARGTTLSPALAAADLDALMLGPAVDQGEIFGDGFESGSIGSWSSAMP